MHDFSLILLRTKPLSGHCEHMNKGEFPPLVPPQTPSTNPGDRPIPHSKHSLSLSTQNAHCHEEPQHSQAPIVKEKNGRRKHRPRRRRDAPLPHRPPGIPGKTPADASRRPGSQEQEHPARHARRTVRTPLNRQFRSFKFFGTLKRG